MKNKDIKLPENIEIKPFKEALLNSFKHNLTPTLCSSVSKLLAIDYSIRLASKLSPEDHLNNCVSKLRNYLGYKVVQEDDFSTSMTLFSVAISPEINSGNDKSTSQEQSVDEAIETIISAHFGQTSADDQAILRIVIRELLTGENNKEILNFINSDPKIFYSIVLTASKAKKKQKEIAEIAHVHINNILIKSKKIDQKISKIKSFSQQATLAGGLILAASAALLVGGLVMPALAVPAIIASVKLAPLLGDKIADININSNKFLKTEQKELNELKSKSISLDPKDISQSITKEKAQEITKEKIQEITKDLAVHATESKSFTKEQQSIAKATKHQGRRR